MDGRFGPLAGVLGYATLTVGIALILHPALRDVAAAAVHDNQARLRCRARLESRPRETTRPCDW